ncbi:MAG TPA: YbbR-like domain-containing protein [Planctomycetota bacterium]|nr:YbbR-like domain-containing protein [Planctomycetota bacterium]
MALSYFGKVLRVIFIDDPVLKLICLALSLLLWFYIDGELTGQKDFELQMRPSDIALADSLELAAPDKLPKFKVTVRGPRGQIELWRRENLRFKHKILDNPHPGRNPVNVSTSDVEAENLIVVSVAPLDSASEAVDIVATAAEMKPVRARVRGQPSGFLVGKPIVSPDQVRIKGSRDDINSLDEVWTADIDVSSADHELNLDVPIVERREIGDKIIVFQCPEKVHVTIPVEPVKVPRTQTLDVWARVPPGLAMRIQPQTVEVEVVIEERDFKDPNILSKISLYVEWPSAWDRPKDTNTVLGPVPVQVKFSAPPRVQVRGVKDSPLPTVNVTGALAGGLK